jgi:predicted DNA binding protein
MNKIVFLLILALNVFALDLNEFKVDVYFINGINNSQKEATESTRLLEEIFNSSKLLKENSKYKNYSVKTLYNWSGKDDNNKTGVWFDLQETFILLKEQDNPNLYKYNSFDEIFSDLLIYSLTKSMSVYDKIKNLPDILKNKYISNEEKILSTIYETVNVFIKQIEKQSLQKGHRVILVAHSEGNLFANMLFDSLQGFDEIENKQKTEQDYLRIVSVGTPTNHVRLDYSNNAPYTTLKNDLVIGGVPRHLPANIKPDGSETDPVNHNFNYK